MVVKKLLQNFYVKSQISFYCAALDVILFYK